MGLLLWNIFYDGLLKLEMPTGVQVVGFADDVAVVGTAHITEHLERVSNPALSMVAGWVRAEDIVKQDPGH